MAVQQNSTKNKIFRHAKNRKDDTTLHYLKAVKLEPLHAEAQYNLGLLYFDLKKYHIFYILRILVSNDLDVDDLIYKKQSSHLDI